MELKLSKPIEEMIPKKIDWNNAEVMTAVENMLEKYKGIMYSDSQIVEAKEDRALLRGWVKSIDNARIEYHKIYEEPYEKFKGQLEEVTSLIKKTTNEIDVQIKDFETRKEAEKREQIIEIFNEVFADIKDDIPLDILFDTRWLNVTVKLPKIRQTLEEKHEKILQDIQTIKDLKHEHEEFLIGDYLVKLDLPAVLRSEKEREDRLSQAQKYLEEKEKSAVNPTKKQDAPASKTDTEQVNKLYTVAFEVKGDIAQMKALKKFFVETKIKYSKIEFYKLSEEE